MPRANRYILPGHVYHVTHRCHDQSFLFRFAGDREQYRRMLRDRSRRYPVAVLGYCITSNHTHLLLKTQGDGDEALGRFMQSLEGDFAQAYNARKKRSGAFWSDRYHAVMIDSGQYLWRCMQYIDLNMVRAGVVRTPRDWRWCGFQEIAGLRKRYRVVDVDTWGETLGFGQPTHQVVRQYVETIENAIRMGNLTREGYWTESLAVGSASFARETGRRIRNRMAVEVEETGDGSWRVREEPSAYGRNSGLKAGAKESFPTVCQA